MTTRTSTLSISKLDAARRQIEVAIRLYFSNDDPISIYTLGAAGYGVLRDIAVAKSMSLRTAEQGLMERVVPGKEKELIAALRRHQNFFKHADRDPDAAIDFNPDSTEWLLFDSCIAYLQITGESTPLMRTMNLWWQIQHRDLVKAEYPEIRSRLEQHADLLGNRLTYFSKVLPMMQAIHARH